MSADNSFVKCPTSILGVGDAAGVVLIAEQHHLTSSDNAQAAVRDNNFEAAILAGEWDSLNKVISTTKILDYYHDDSDSQSQSSSRLSSLASLNRVNLDLHKVNELDKLIQEGNWSGIELAAARFEEEDEKSTSSAVSSLSASSITKDLTGTTIGKQSCTHLLPKRHPF
jgi:hypothetical protein